MKSCVAKLVDKELIVDANPYMLRVVLIENGRAAEMYIERRSSDRLVGNIYKGRVQNVLPGMNAAFVEIGEEKNAFLYTGDVYQLYLDGDRLDVAGDKKKINDILKNGQSIMIQIVKEPSGTKGARAGTHISLPGHTLVFMPDTDFIGISKRITDDEERSRLKTIIDKYRPNGGGVIVRTSAEGRDEDAIRSDLDALVDVWKNIKSAYNTARAPKLIHQEESLTSRTIRDLMKVDVRRLVVNDRAQYEQLLSIAEEIDPCMKERIELRDGEHNLFESLGIEKEIDNALARKVWLKSGAYLVIDQTEALVSIDVNTGKNVGDASLNRTIVETNCEAAVEIAHQMRLRDLSGIIIIDFIDMEDKSDRETVVSKLKEALRSDRTRSVVLGMTELGLVEVTRKKLRKNIALVLETPCPYCYGSGRVSSAESVALSIRSRLITAIREGGDDQFCVTANPRVIDTLREYISSESLNDGVFSSAVIKLMDSPMMHIERYSIKAGSRLS